MQVEFLIAFFQINSLILLNSLELHSKIHCHPSGSIYPWEYAGSLILPHWVYSISGGVKGTEHFFGDIQQIAGAMCLQYCFLSGSCHIMLCSN